MKKGAKHTEETKDRISESMSGNSNAIGNDGGRPPLYENVESMQKNIDKYFRECDELKTKVFNKQTQSTEEIPTPRPYTIQGLALYLGFSSVQSLLDYEKKTEFVDAIKRAKLKVENNKVERGLVGSVHPTFVIFDLKNNHGWKDKTEVENKHEFKPSDLSKLSQDELSALAKIKRKMSSIDNE